MQAQLIVDRAKPVDDGARAQVPAVVRRNDGAGVGPSTLDPSTITVTEPPAVFAMNGRRVLLAALFNFALAVLAALFGVTRTIGNVAGFDFFAYCYWRKALDDSSPIADLILAHQIVTAVVGMLFLLLLGLATGVTRTVLRDYRFRLERTGTGLRRRRGLFTLTDVTGPVRRVQAAIIGSEPLRGHFGWSDLKLQSLAKDEGTKGDHVVAPFARREEFTIILGELKWRPVDPLVEWSRISPAFAWSFTVGVGLLPNPVFIQSLAMPWVGAAGATAIAVLIATCWLSLRRFNYALDGDRLLVRSGWWRRRELLLPLNNIQSADITENIFSRRFGTASVTLGVASSRGYSSHGIPARNREIADALRRQLLTPG